MFRAALRALNPLRNFQQWDDESLQTPNKELNLVILLIWLGTGLGMTSLSPLFPTAFPVNTQKSSFGAIKETDVPEISWLGAYPAPLCSSKRISLSSCCKFVLRGCCSVTKPPQSSGEVLQGIDSLVGRNFSPGW